MTSINCSNNRSRLSLSKVVDQWEQEQKDDEEEEEEEEVEDVLFPHVDDTATHSSSTNSVGLNIISIDLSSVSTMTRMMSSSLINISKPAAPTPPPPLIPDCVSYIYKEEDSDFFNLSSDSIHS